MGVVTITKEIEEDYYRLRVPNLEVWKVFKELTACHLKIDERHMEKMLNALKRKDMERFAEEYQTEIPIIAAGGIFDVEDVRRVMALGVDGVQIASRFVERIMISKAIGKPEKAEVISVFMQNMTDIQI
mgnify:CR=1 FL=1